MPHSPHGAIRENRFFRTLDWRRLEAHELEPPYKPASRAPDDVQNFDADFTVEPPTLTPCDSELLQTMRNDLFAGFSFTNPLFTPRSAK